MLVAGAGAAGLTAAYFAAMGGARVTLVERTDKAGKKILMSGGTRCNVLPVVMEPDDYHTGSSPNRLRNIFKTWNLEACHRWFTDELGLPLACEVETNKWFPVSNEARDVRDALVNACLRAGVRILYDTPLTRLKPVPDGWSINGGALFAEKVVLASGGYSVPSIGTDGLGHQALAGLGLASTPVYPALTPLRGAHPGGAQLAGITLQVAVDVVAPNGAVLARNRRSGFLFTHTGFSGPAVLDVSHHWIRAHEAGETPPRLLVSWDGRPAEAWDTDFRTFKGTVRGLLHHHLPARLADALLASSPHGDAPLAELGKDKRRDWVLRMAAYPLAVAGHEGWRKAEVTGGGIPLDVLDPATMEVRTHPGLHLCGEILDVFGRIGGFNFYWAWVSGRLAGQKVSAAR